MLMLILSEHLSLMVERQVILHIKFLFRPEWPVEMLRQPQVLNPSDKIIIRSTDVDRNGADDIIDVYISYEEKTSTDLVGVGLGAVGLLPHRQRQFIHQLQIQVLFNQLDLQIETDAGGKAVSVLVGDRYLVDNLIVPKYASIEVLDQLKRIETDDTIKVQLDEGGSIDVQVSAKKNITEVR